MGDPSLSHERHCLQSERIGDVAPVRHWRRVRLGPLFHWEWPFVVVDIVGLSAERLQKRRDRGMRGSG